MTGYDRLQNGPPVFIGRRRKAGSIYIIAWDCVLFAAVDNTGSNWISMKMHEEGIKQTTRAQGSLKQSQAQGDSAFQPQTFGAAQEVREETT